MSDPRNTVLVDIDHVVSNAFWRDDMVGVQSWDDYHAASVDDPPISDIIRLVSALKAHGFFLVGMTARPEKWRRLTQDWLVKHEVDLDWMLMRADEDYRPAQEVKLTMAVDYFGSEEEIKGKVAFILEDHEAVIATFRGLGVTTLQVSGRRD